MAADRLPLNQVLSALDKKDRGFYDRTPDDKKKQITPFLLNRYMSVVEADVDLSSYYLMSTNQRVNTHYFDYNGHPKLQWLLLTTVSPGLGTVSHKWLAGGKKKDPKDKTVKKEKFLAEVYPTYKEDEIELLAKISTDAELVALAETLGLSKADIKKKLK